MQKNTMQVMTPSSNLPWRSMFAVTYMQYSSYATLYHRYYHYYYNYCYYYHYYIYYS